MFLAIDIGNTNSVFAICENHKIICSWRCKTDSGRTSDEYISWLHPLFQRAGLDFEAIEGGIVSSVVPDINFNLRRFYSSSWGKEPLFAGQESAGIAIELPNPEEVGADRLVNAVAALNKYGSPAIVVDFGTATTFDVINSTGVYCGGVIAPGINLSLDALHQAAAKLPRVRIEKPPTITGRDTVGAMQSGIYWGYTSLLEGILKRLKIEMNEANPTIIATGGLAPLFADSVPEITIVDHELTLTGLIHIYHEEKNKEN